MQKNISLSMLLFFLSAAGCQLEPAGVQKEEGGYRIKAGTHLIVLLQTPLSSNSNERGDPFSSELKAPLQSQGGIILAKGAQIRGLVKRVTRYKKFGDRASLLLLFDQLVLPNGDKIPISASLDTKEGERAINIPGKNAARARVVGRHIIAGALLGEMGLEEQGAEQGILAGAAVGTGAVFLSESQAVTLPEKTELLIKLDDSVFIPK